MTPRQKRAQAEMDALEAGRVRRDQDALARLSAANPTPSKQELERRKKLIEDAEALLDEQNAPKIDILRARRLLRVAAGDYTRALGELEIDNHSDGALTGLAHVEEELYAAARRLVAAENADRMAPLEPKGGRS